MNMVMISFEYPPRLIGGIGQLAKDKYEAFRRLGHSVTLIAPVGSSDPAGDVYSLPVRKNLLKTAILFLQLLRVLLKRNSKPELLYCMSGTYIGFVCYILSKLTGLPYVVMAHGNEFVRFKHSPVHHLLRKVYNGSRYVFAVSGFTRGELESIGVQPERIRVVHNGVDTRVFYPAEEAQVAELRKELDIAPEDFCLFTVSRLDKRKGHVKVLEAMRSLLDEDEEHYGRLKYVFGGKGPELEAIENFIHRHGLEEHVRYAGFIEDAELPTYYSAADLFVMPSMYLEQEGNVEGFGIVFIEAAACGTPSLGGNTGGMADAIEHGETGYVVDGADTKDIQRTLRYLYENHAELRRISENAYVRAVNSFDIQTICSTEIDMLQTAAGI